ncbi:cyclodeaminase/cyclohydrolase family protein [Chelatococcus sambhunathii]|uniref:Cyclodeaminase/cyclohydrolase family protein n=1 Tax=Chelatococcus sambhunathii TaxID=363953 RepID=A0ABU1DCK0_9HYPH|nr:methenyltetrahydrofolate cyclohydrolase [Chelatococcus sambhunathii]MDR4305645.1 cyclodeaminase/cyclohydrolase family protein [Chelatococcus sambhunathii]
MAEAQAQALGEFLDDLASERPTPGGGGAAAISGAMGAALVSMVCNLTIGKPKYVEVEGELKEVLVRSERLRGELTKAIGDDVKAFDAVMGAYGLPKGETDEGKAARTAKIQAALKEATDVPLECARLCAEVIKLAEVTAEKGNLNVISDAGVAVQSAYAGLMSAALNVRVNAASIKDREFADGRLSELEALLGEAGSTTLKTYDVVKSKLG